MTQSLNSTDYALLGLLLLGLAVFAVHFRRRHGVRPADPANLIFLAFLIGTTAPLVYFVFFRAKWVTRSLGLPSDPMILGREESFLVVGLAFITACIAAMLLGSDHRGSIDLRPPPLPPLGRTIPGIAAISCIAAFLGLLVFLNQVGAFETGDFFAKRFNQIEGGATNRLHSGTYWSFKLLSSVKYAFYALVICWLSRGERGDRKLHLLLLGTLLLSVLVPAAVGNRSHSMIMLLDLLILLGLRPRRTRIVMVGAGTLVILALILVTTTARQPAPPSAARVNIHVAEANRIAENRGGYQKLDPTRVERSLWFAEAVGVDTARRVDGKFRGRYFLSLFKTAHIVAAVPAEEPFLYGGSLGGWALLPVPSSWLPEPLRFPGLARELAEGVFLEPTNNVPPGLIGEAWWNFGWFGIAFMGVLGMGLGLMQNTYERISDHAVAQVVYAMLVTRLAFLTLNSSLGDGILKAAVDILPVVVLVAWATRFERRRSGATKGSV